MTEPGFTKNDISLNFPDHIRQLRLDFIQLVCMVASKYHSVRDQDLSCVDRNDSFDSKSHDTDQEARSVCSHLGSDSSSSYGMESGEDDSSFEPEHDEVEVDGNDVLQSNEEDDIEEMYSDYYDIQSKSKETESYQHSNLICPGDVLEYCIANKTDPPSRGTVVSIIRADDGHSILLQCGTLLRQGVHTVKKVKMYCSSTDVHLPVPLSGWHRLENCLLQVGTIDSSFHMPEDECSNENGMDNNGEREAAVSRRKTR